MTNKQRILLSALVAATLGTMPAQAQGLGKFLNKVKKGVEKVTGSLSTETTTQSTPTRLKTDSVAGGGTISNPFPQICDIQLVGAYGKATSANYGEVRLVFKVKMIANKNEIRFGGNINYPVIMVDQDDNSYTPRVTAGWYSYSVTEGVYMKIAIKDTQTFIDVKQTATTIQQLQIGVSTDSDHNGLVILRDVPIQWGVEP